MARARNGGGASIPEGTPAPAYHDTTDHVLSVASDSTESPIGEVPDVKPDASPPPLAVVFPPCRCGRPAVVAVGSMAWCYRHVAEAIRLLERMAEVGR